MALPELRRHQDACRRVFARLRYPIVRSVRGADRRLATVGWLGVVGFPLFGWYWSAVVPQPYENPWLRAAGALLGLGFAFVARWPAPLRRRLPAIWYATLVAVLPFFFTYMALRNDLNHVWSMSMLVASFLLILVVDWLNLIVMSVLGAGLAWLAYVLTAPVVHVPESGPMFVMIYVFAVIAGVVFNLSEEIVAREKRAATMTVGASIAHELRTPLLSIRSAAEGVSRYLPRLVDAYRAADRAGLPVAEIRDRHLDGMDGVLQRLVSEVAYANAMIDILLANVSEPRVEPGRLQPQSMRHCVDVALDRYPFNPAAQRDKVRRCGDRDFVFLGTETLMVHVIFNLLKNALAAIERNGGGDIEIVLRPGARRHRMVFRDTGTGIAPDVLPRLFQPFASFGGTGTGLGLAFCKRVIESVGGEIQVRSEVGSFSEFVISLPPSGDSVDVEGTA